MDKKVLILSTSPRKGGNSDLLAEEFARGAADAGNRVETIRLADQTIEFCRGCLACQRTGRCAIRDDAGAIIQKMQKADILVFATPKYFYEMSGQMKTLLDRSNPLFSTGYAFRDIYFLATAAEDGNTVPALAIDGLQGWIDCFGQTRLIGTVFGGGVNEKGEIRRFPEKLRQAYAMGRAV